MVDDDPLVCKLVSTSLEACSYVVKVVHNGKIAFDQLKLFPFDLVVLDIEMPEMNGWQLIRLLRSRPETVLLPVIFLTGLSMEKHRVLGFQLGADDYLPKPFDMEELVLRVERVLRRTSSRVAKNLNNAALQGSLTDIGLGPLLTLLEMEGKSGLLRLSKGSEKCILYLRDGDVIRTRRNSAGLRGAETVYDALRWTEGTFQFKMDKVGGHVEIENSTIQLLMEASRRIDEQVL